MAHRYAEGQKIIFDWFKHITTLSSGSIVILTAFLQIKPITELTQKAIISTALFFLGISIIFAVRAMGELSYMIQMLEEVDTSLYTEALNRFNKNRPIAYQSFLIGEGLVILFAISNFFI